MAIRPNSSHTTPPSRLLRRTRIAAKMGFAAYVAASLLVWSARWFWLGEVAASFAWHLGLAGFAATILLLATRSRRIALLTIALSTAHAGPELWLFLPDSRAGGTAPQESASPAAELSIASCNLLWGNTDRASFDEWLTEHDPDVLVCLEVSPKWREVLESSDGYHHILLSPLPSQWNRTTWGTAILSKRPFESTRLLQIPSGKSRPLMEAKMRIGSRTVTIRGAHPMRAGAAWRLDLRDEVLNRLANLDWDDAGLLLGDLNATSTSPVFGDLVERTGLRDSRAGFGRQPTYTLDKLMPGLSIAIDHILVGEAIRVVERKTVTLPGSDHLSVFARVVVDSD